MENGKWKQGMENGEWKMENGKWKMENVFFSTSQVFFYWTPFRTGAVSYTHLDVYKRQEKEWFLQKYCAVYIPVWLKIKHPPLEQMS